MHENTKEVTGYDASNNPIYGQDLLKPNLLIQFNIPPQTIINAIYGGAAKLKSQAVRYTKDLADKINVSCNFNVTGRMGATITVMLTAWNNGEVYALTTDGTFLKVSTQSTDKMFLRAQIGESASQEVGTINFSFSGLWDSSEINIYDFEILILAR